MIRKEYILLFSKKQLKENKPSHRHPVLLMIRNKLFDNIIIIGECSKFFQINQKRSGHPQKELHSLQSSTRKI